MTRFCFQLQVRPELLDEFVAFHREMPRDMLEALRDAGRRHYSLFLREDGLLIGCYEAEDDELAARRLAADARAIRWEAEAVRFFSPRDDGPGPAGARLEEVFHLENQLARTS